MRLDRPAPSSGQSNTADGSVGITKDAVVRTRTEALDYLAWFRATLPGRDALMQEYLPGREYGVGLIGNPETGLHMLPPLEVDFSGLTEGLALLAGYPVQARCAVN